MIRKYDEEIDFEKQWHDLTKLLDEAIQLIHKMVALSPCKTDDHGFCREHNEDGCTFMEAEIWLSDIQ